MLDNRILSRLREAPTGDFIYSSLSFYGRHVGGALPGVWFVAALIELEVEEGAIRQTLFRMSRSGELETSRVGRIKLYWASATTRAILEAGVSRIFESTADEWDGQWTLVHFRFDKDMRQARERVRDLLRVEGFATLSPGLYIHPRDRSLRVKQAVADLGLAKYLQVFRGSRETRSDDQIFVKELWDVAQLVKRYRAFLNSFKSLGSINARHWTPAEAFALRFACVFRFLRITWDDPDLPGSLLPENWPGREAQELTRSMYETLQERALEYGDEIRARVWPESVSAKRLNKKR